MKLNNISEVIHKTRTDICRWVINRYFILLFFI